MNPLAPYVAMAKLIALLGAMAIICWQSSQVHRWHKQYLSEHSAHLATIANYRAAAEQAAADDAANAARVKAEQDKISKEQADEYQKRIAAARAAAERLRARSQADSGSAAKPPVPSLPASPIRVTEGAGQDRFSIADRLIATEQAIQLDELITWVKRQADVDVNANPKPEPKKKHRSLWQRITPW